MEIRRYAALILRYWATQLAVVLIAVILGAVIFLLQPAQYTASTRVFVSVKSSPDASQLLQGGTYAQDIVSSYASVASTPLILSPVITRLKLDTTPQDLSNRVTASAAAGTVIIEISATDRSPRQAARIADSVASQLATSVELLSPTTGPTGSFVQITQLEHAAVPQRPAEPNLALIAAAALAIGILGGFALVALREVFDARVHNIGEVAGLVGAPLLGSISQDPSVRDSPLATTRSSGDPNAEEYRTLRTNLQFINPGQDARSWVITSALESEGKTLTAANLAVVMAELNLRVVVVDADLRRPSLAERLGIESAIGLTDVVIGKCSLDEAIQTWGANDLAVLPAGSIPPNPNELLQSAQAAEVYQELKRRYNVILYDAPPLLSVSDAAVLARLADGAILLAGLGRVRRPQLHASEQALRRVGAEVVGVVATLVPKREAAQYGYAYGYMERYRNARQDTLASA